MSGEKKAEKPAATADVNERGIFQLPRPTWVADKDVTECVECKAEFTTFNRKHHCRQCGRIYCGKCCSRRMTLPQLGYDSKERVCDSCVEVAYLVAYAVSDTPTTQCHGARSLGELASKDEGLPKVVSLGGLDVLIFLCSSPHADVATIATGVLETLARRADVQNTIVEKDGLKVLLDLCKYSDKKPLPALANACRILFHLSKNGDVCEKIVEKGGFGALLDLATKQIAGNESATLKATQALSVRTISYLAVNDRNQTRFLEDKQGNLRVLTELLFVADNEDVRKYAAKTLAYLSLRNDKLKAGLLAGKGVQALVEALQGNTSVETLSHVACTIANLATNNESQELLVQDTRLFQALCALTESPTERADILRHVARGLANFALYDSNKPALVRVALQALSKLGESNAVETQRHVIRAVDNLLSTPSDEIVSGLTRAGFLQMLEKCIATNSTVAEAADMVRRASQAQQVLAAAASRSSAAVPVIAAEPEESSQPQANDDDQESSLA